MGYLHAVERQPGTIQAQVAGGLGRGGLRREHQGMSRKLATAMYLGMTSLTWLIACKAPMAIRGVSSGSRCRSPERERQPPDTFCYMPSYYSRLMSMVKFLAVVIGYPSGPGQQMAPRLCVKPKWPAAAPSPPSP